MNTFIGAVKSRNWKIKTEKDLSGYVGYLYYNGKLVYSSGRLKSRSAAKKSMENSKDLLIHTLKNFDKKKFNSYMKAYHNLQKEDLKLKGRELSKLTI